MTRFACDIVSSETFGGVRNALVEKSMTAPWDCDLSMSIPDVAFASVPCCCLLICQTSEALQRCKAVGLLALTNAIKRPSRTLYRLEDVVAWSALYESTRCFNDLAYDAMRGAKCC